MKTIKFRISEKSFDRLNVLRIKTEADSFDSVLNNALKLYERMIELSENNVMLQTSDSNGEVKNLKIFE